MTGVTVSLGNGSDRLTLSLSATGPGANAIAVAGNTFDGGRGTDRLVLGDGSFGNPAAIVDVHGGHTADRRDWHQHDMRVRGVPGRFGR